MCIARLNNLSSLRGGAGVHKSAYIQGAALHPARAPPPPHRHQSPAEIPGEPTVCRATEIASGRYYGGP